MFEISEGEDYLDKSLIENLKGKGNQCWFEDFSFEVFENI